MGPATGISRPVTLCGPKHDLDPSPCVAVDDVTLDNPFAYLDKGGAFHFRDNVTLPEIVALAPSEYFVLPVKSAAAPP